MSGRNRAPRNNNPLAEGLPLPQGDILEVGAKTYQVVRLPACEGTYLLLLEVSHLAVRVKAYQSLLQVLKGLMQHEEPEGLLKDLIREAVEGDDLGALLKEADGRMYQAKRAKTGL
ncbi:hypothetical protein [Thermus caldifontis]|uniref:hypothetical protein n=1 Tax=Thermus caldifontis TaxID=1930763 RepID=UPI000DF31EE2|nr:hypothetical protein [Thermus caldifontis]